MIVDVEFEQAVDGATNVFLIGDTEGAMPIKEFVEMIGMFINRLDQADPKRYYNRPWQEKGEIML